eukprot:s3436_g2.t1
MSHAHADRERESNESNDDDQTHTNFGVPNEINPFGPDYKKMRVKRVRLGRCICGRIAEWRFRTTHATEKIGYGDQPESPDDVHQYNSDESSQESIPRDQRRRTLGPVSDITLEPIQPMANSSAAAAAPAEDEVAVPIVPITAEPARPAEGTRQPEQSSLSSDSNGSGMSRISPMSNLPPSTPPSTPPSQLLVASPEGPEGELQGHHQE